MESVRLGYVGCGFMAQKVHIPNFTSLPQCRLEALAEVRADLRQKVARRFGIPRQYGSHEEMAEAGSLDAVAISAGYALQGEMAIAFLRRGIPVFMEKPMATTLVHARRILDAAAAGGGRLMIGYMKRYDAGNLMAREAIREFRASGEVGEPTLIRGHGFCGDWVAGLDTPMESSSEPMPPSPTITPDWLPVERQRSYLGFLQQYTHNINLMRWLLDAGDKASVRMVDLNEDGMTGVTILEVDGVRAVLETGGLDYHSWDEQTQVYFRQGWVKAASPPLLLRNAPAEVEIYRSRPDHAFVRPTAPWSWAYKREAEEFIRCVLSGDPFDSSGEDTLTDVRLFEEIYCSWLGIEGTS
jgi:predicted dehydrogenase